MSLPLSPDDAPSSEKLQHPSFRTNLNSLLCIAFNLVCQSLSGFGIGLSTFIWIGTLGPLAMGACTLGQMFANISGNSLIFGCATALDSLCAQEYGAKRYAKIGLHTQRAILILTLFSIPTVFLWSQAEFILHTVLFIPEDIAHHAGFWCRTLSAGLFPTIVFECLKKSLQARNIVWPAVITTTVGLAFNISANFYVLRIQKGGYDAAAKIVPCQNWLHMVLYITIIVCRKMCIRRSQRIRKQQQQVDEMMPLEDVSTVATPASAKSGYRGGQSEYAKVPLTELPSKSGEKKTEEGDDRDDESDDPENDWPALSPAILQEWKPFLELGIPGAASLFIEWGSFELAASIAGQLGSVGLAAHGINMSTCGLLYMIPMSVSSATTTIAGHIIGSGDAPEAKKILGVGIALDLAYGLLAAALLLFALRDRWASVFTQDVPTQELIYETMPALALYTVVDATKCITLNILRSGGMPQITVKVNAFVCIVVMVPLGWYLALRMALGLSGLWFSMSLAWGLATLAFGWILFRLDLRELKVIRE